MQVLAHDRRRGRRGLERWTEGTASIPRGIQRERRQGWQARWKAAATERAWGQKCQGAVLTVRDQQRETALAATGRQRIATLGVSGVVFEDHVVGAWAAEMRRGESDGPKGRAGDQSLAW